jgi:hypothetical protein
VVSLRLAAAGATGRPRPFDVDPEQGIVVSVARGGMDVLLTFSAPTATLCSLAGPSPA